MGKYALIVVTILLFMGCGTTEQVPEYEHTPSCYIHWSKGYMQEARDLCEEAPFVKGETIAKSQSKALRALIPEDERDCIIAAEEINKFCDYISIGCNAEYCRTGLTVEVKRDYNID